MSALRLGFVAALWGLCAIGCGGTSTKYTPSLVARGELTLRSDDGLQMWAGGEEVASSYDFDGLPEYVRCVPRAKDHADVAAFEGGLGTGLSIAGVMLGVGSLGSLGGIALYEENPAATVGILSVGVAVALTGLMLGAVSQRYKRSARGNAVDAMNYYNDAVGSLGATCDDLTYPAPVGPENEPSDAGVDPPR